MSEVRSKSERLECVRGWALAVGAVLLVGAMTACGGEQTVAKAGSVASGAGAATVSMSATPSATDETSFSDGVLVTPDVRIEITDHRVIPIGKKGNEYGDKPVLAFWYNTTNLSGKDVDPSEFIFDFEVYQDNNPNAMNKLEVGMLPDDRFLDTQDETIKMGGTVESAIAYELDDLTTPIDLVATDGLLSSEIGRMRYPLDGSAPSSLVASSASASPDVTTAGFFDGHWATTGDKAGVDADISGGTITVTITGDGGEKSLYWEGTFQGDEGSKSIVSQGDVAAMSKSLLGSQSKTKEFTYKDGDLVFTFSMMGQSIDMRLER